MRRCGAGLASVTLSWVQPLQSEKGMVGMLSQRASRDPADGPHLSPITE